MSGIPSDQLVFFLGGHDLEMLTIRDLLATESCVYFDHHLAWGAKASDYQTEIASCLLTHRLPVLVELSMDLLPPPDRWICIDHHRPMKLIIL